MQGHKPLCPQHFTCCCNSEMTPFCIRKLHFRLLMHNVEKLYPGMSLVIFEAEDDHKFTCKSNLSSASPGRALSQRHLIHGSLQCLHRVLLVSNLGLRRSSVTRPRSQQWENGKGQGKINLRLLSLNVSLILTKILGHQHDAFV